MSFKLILRKVVAASILVAATIIINGALCTEVSAQGGKLGEILRRMDQHNKGLTTLRTKVTMGKQDTRLGDDPEIRTGTAIYVRRQGKDAMVRIDWTQPNESLAVADGKYTIYRPRLSMAYTGSVKKASTDTKGSSALAFMNMSKAELDANYTAAYLGEAKLSDGTDTIHIQLTPKQKATYKSAELWIDVDGMPRQSKIIEANDDITTVLLSGLEKNISLKASDFKISYPDGTKVQPT